MEIQTEELGLAADPEVRDPQPPDTWDPLWQIAGTLYRQRKLITRFTLFAVVLAVALALLLPRWYLAEARVLTPESGGGMLGMLQAVAPGAASLFGTGGDYPRYLSILTSRSMKIALIEEFDLVPVYDLEDSETPIDDALVMLEKNTGFEVSMDYNYLSIRAFDKDPERAARMANFMVRELNDINANLASQNARQTRLFIEGRLAKAEGDLDSVRVAMQSFQERNGLIELESQAQAFMLSMAELKGGVAELEVQYQTLVQQYGPDNPQVQAARQALSAARGQVSGAMAGRDALLPVSMDELPNVSRQYAELIQAQLIQAQVIETIYPLYEQALFQEQNESVAVQIVDDATPPVLAARPSRRLVVAAITLTAIMLICLFVIIREWFRQNARGVALRLEQAASDTQ